MVEVTITECGYKVGEKHLGYNMIEKRSQTILLEEEDWAEMLSEMFYLSSEAFKYWGYDTFKGVETYVEYTHDECETEYWYEVKENVT